MANMVLQQPKHSRYDVVIAGGAMFGSSVAWFLSTNSDFNGSILVVEKDTSYQACSTTHTNSCIRQQFSRELNIQISQSPAVGRGIAEIIIHDEYRSLDLSPFSYERIVSNQPFNETAII